MTATDKETLEQKLRAELEKASFIVVAHYMATNFDKLFAEAVMVVIRPYIDHLTADLKDRDTQIGLLQAGDDWARKDYEALKSENTKQREMLERAHKVLTWLCVPYVNYDVDVQRAPNLTAAAWKDADELLAALSQVTEPLTPEQEGV